MKRFSMFCALALGLAGLMLGGCGDGKSDSASGGSGDGADLTKLSVKELIITAIPDSDSKELKKEYKLVGDFLEKTLGVTVKYESVKDYGAAVTSLVAKKCHIAWLGGKTAVDAENILLENSRPAYFVACRDIDYKFKSYFIANKDVIAKHGLKENDSSLKQLVGKDLTFTFGATGSTSGHLMPRFFLMKEEIDAEETFKGGPKYSGSHSTTLTQVADGTVDVGALNYTDWDDATDDVKKKAPIVFTAEPYTDYVWMGTDMITANDAKLITEAFAKIDGDTEEEKALLAAFGGASKFFKPDPKKWDDIRAILKDPIVVEKLKQ